MHAAPRLLPRIDDATEAHYDDRREGEQGMDHICFALPLLPGKTQDARDFQRELDGPCKAEYAASEQRSGIVKEHWFLQQTAQGDLFLAYMESPAFAQALAQFAQSQDAFDQWFKQRLAAVT